MYLNEMSVDQISVDEMPVDEMPVDEMSVDEMTWCQILFEFEAEVGSHENLKWQKD